MFITRLSPSIIPYARTRANASYRGELTGIEVVAALPRLVALLATRVGQLVNLADVSRTMGIPHTTLQRYMALLERTSLIHQVPGWGMNLGARVLKSGKLIFADTGLATALLRLPAARLMSEAIGGPMLEDFVIMELRKQASWHEEQPQLYHFRTPKGLEVDVVIELEGGEVIGIEVTRGQTVTGEDFRGLHELARLAVQRSVPRARDPASARHHQKVRPCSSERTSPVTSLMT